MMMIVLFMSLTFLFMKHPLSMGMILLIQTIMIALNTGLMALNFWFSYILFLILIGGMLILFIYMTSIASNEKFSINPKLFILIIPSWIMYKYTNSWNSEYMNSEIKMNMNYNIVKIMTKYVMFPSNLILIMTILYLLFTLVASIKIIKTNQGPLRSKN